MMNKKTIPIVLSTDNEYALYTQVTISSILAHSSFQHDYHLFVLYKELDAKYIRSIVSMSREHFTIQTMRITDLADRYSDIYYERDHLKEATYYRLFIPILFSEYDYVIYMDSDVVVCDDLAGFIPADLGDNLLGAVCSSRYNEREKSRRESLGVSPDKYFFAGGIVFNTRQWNRENTLDSCLKLFRNNSIDRFELLEMDVLNIVCQNRIRYIAPEWNCVWRYDKHQQEMVVDCPIESVLLLHYASSIKPWNSPFYSLSRFFWQYASTIPDYKEIITIPFSHLKKELSAKNQQLQLMNHIVCDLQSELLSLQQKIKDLELTKNVKQD